MVNATQKWLSVLLKIMGRSQFGPDLVMFSLPNHLTLGDQQKEIPDVGGFAAPDAHLPCRVEKLRFRQKPCHPEEVLNIHYLFLNIPGTTSMQR